jgi:quinol monooxygenase YgiN
MAKRVFGDAHSEGRVQKARALSVSASRFLGFCAAMIVVLTGAPALSQNGPEQHIQIAEIVVDPAHLESYKAAVAEQIEAAIRLEPGVLVLYSVVSKEDPGKIIVFEIYRDRDAYLAHLKAPHFLKYKATVEPMVKSLTLIPVERIMLGERIARDHQQ